MRPIFLVSLKALLSGKRWLLVLLLDAIFVVLSAILGFTSKAPQHERQLVDLFYGLVLPFVLPFVALLFASEALGAEVEDRTIVYLTLRPLPAVAIALPKFVASALVTVLAVWLALLGGFALLGEGNVKLLPSLLIAGLLGGLAYCGVFLWLGLIQRRALLVGAIYILLWEGAVATFSTAAAHLSVRFYALGTFSGLLRRSDLLPPENAGPAAAGSIVLLVAVTIAAIAQTAYRLRRIELK